ncbi:MAG: response regulator transcription factor [Verrucomicrobiales bacterium]|nr:response regulator transcription factor [Verrucomicrobiales bacterium]
MVEKRIVLVDDHPISRGGVKALISAEPDLNVCGEAGSTREALAILDSSEPDLVIIDISLPDRSGLELIKDLHFTNPNLLMLALSMHDENVYAQRVLQAGGKGYLMKDNDAGNIIRAIRTVLNGRIFLSDAMSSRLLELLAPKDHQVTLSPLEKLSDRECEVFQLIGNGRKQAEIAKQLGISLRTVDAHRNAIRTKLKLPGNHEVTLYAVKWAQTQSAQPYEKPL